MLYSKQFLNSMQRLMLREGGWADRPEAHDPGGPTMYGITLRTFNDWRKNMEKNGPVNKQTMRGIFIKDGAPLREGQTLVKDIYWYMYWNKVAIDGVPHIFLPMLFDIRVLQGVRGIKLVQSLLGVAQDGVVGPNTAEALELKAQSKLTAGPFVASVHSARLNYLKTRKHWEHNKNGWTSRLADVTAETMELIGAIDAKVVTTYPEERAASPIERHERLNHADRVVPAMRDNGDGTVTVTTGEIAPDTTERSNAMEETKKAHESKTVWASAIAIVAALLSLLGFDIAPEDVALIGGHVEELIAIVASFVAIWMRVKATKKIA